MLGFCDLLFNSCVAFDDFKARKGVEFRSVISGGFVLLVIHILEVYELKGIPQRASESMRRRRIFSLLGCGQCSRILHGSRMAIDSPATDWFLTSKAKQ